MRTSLKPLAHLVDAAAEQWLAAEHESPQRQLDVSNQIANSFRLGERSELTFHGIEYILTLERISQEDVASHFPSSGNFGDNTRITVHKIAQ